jgi:alginate O-acetyltransferase complex protein AlgI
LVGRCVPGLLWLVRSEVSALLIPSVVFNYYVGLLITRSADGSARSIMIAAVAANLACLGYFKYIGFAVANINWLTSSHIQIETPTLPLGISFFTFTQIAFLVDTYRRQVREYRFMHYALFVTYFPHLVAGPILHHKEMIPQFERPSISRFSWEHFAVGISIFAIGLFKKVWIADSLSEYAETGFSTAGPTVSFIDAWAAALSFALQIYFDFSAYCDMAIGMSWIFGVKLPINFFSPYKAASIIQFWRTWHMTLSRFLRDYVYIPLGGNKRGPARRYVNLMLTMLIGGLWHGANWNFVIWGGLHGAYLSINHLWRNLFPNARFRTSKAWTVFSIGLTFVAVVFAWVFFRAETTATAVAMTKGMLGLNGIILPISYEPWLGGFAGILTRAGVTFGLTPAFYGINQVGVLVAALSIVWILPNLIEVFARYSPALQSEMSKPNEIGAIRWYPSLPWASATAAALFISAVWIYKDKPFIYFQF